MIIDTVMRLEQHGFERFTAHSFRRDNHIENLPGHANLPHAIKPSEIHRKGDQCVLPAISIEYKSNHEQAEYDGNTPADLSGVHPDFAQ